KFFILVGGGKVARNYQKALLEFGAKPSERDWIGINVTILNAEVVRQLFGGYSYSKIIADPRKKIKTTKDIVVGGGYKPGWSTDYVAVLLAKKYGAEAMINLSNIDYVYDKNPKKFKGAKPLKNISWKDFRKIVGNKWDPGLNLPFDPVASKLAEKLKLKVVVMNGKPLSNLKNLLSGRSFKGTVIE
ncbi:MAG: hypothetical protein A3K08_00670, partial [Candidatus Doudnabacteria bacterium RIFCSPLOWO2_01_41_7]